MSEHKLKIILKDTPEARRFIAWVLPTIENYDTTADGVMPEKMRRKDADFQQIEAVYNQAKNLCKTLDALCDAAKLRLASSGWWEQDRIPQDLYDLMFAAGYTLDQQSLRHGGKQTLKDDDIARVRIIAHGFRIFLKNHKISDNKNSVFYRVIEALVKRPQSPKALIKKACRI